MLPRDLKKGRARTDRVGEGERRFLPHNRLMELIQPWSYFLLLPHWFLPIPPPPPPSPLLPSPLSPAPFLDYLPICNPSFCTKLYPFIPHWRFYLPPPFLSCYAKTQNCFYVLFPKLSNIVYIFRWQKFLCTMTLPEFAQTTILPLLGLEWFFA